MSHDDMNTSCSFASLIPFGYKNQKACLLEGAQLAARGKSNREVLAVFGAKNLRLSFERDVSLLRFYKTLALTY